MKSQVVEKALVIAEKEESWYPLIWSVNENWMRAPRLRSIIYQATKKSQKQVLSLSLFFLSIAYFKRVNQAHDEGIRTATENISRVSPLSRRGRGLLIISKLKSTEKLFCRDIFFETSLSSRSRWENLPKALPPSKQHCRALYNI